MSQLLRLLALLATLTMANASASAVPTCSQLLHRCNTRKGCANALINVIGHCPLQTLLLAFAPQPRRPKVQNRRRNLTSSTSLQDSCSDVQQPCIQAIAVLLSVEDEQLGGNLVTCNCSGSQECEADKRRLANCALPAVSAQRALLNAPGNQSCVLATFYCQADVACATALDIALDNCDRLLVQSPWKPECSRKCKHSLDILWSRDRARLLRQCVCDSKAGAELTCALKAAKPTCLGNVQHVFVAESPPATAAASSRFKLTVLLLCALTVHSVLFRFS